MNRVTFYYVECGMCPVEDSEAPRLIDLLEVTRRTTLRKSALYELIAAGELKPVKLGTKTTFLESEVTAFINRKVAAARHSASA